MKLIIRDHCIISDQNDLEFLHCFEKFPVHMGCVDTPPENDLLADMSWWISKSSGCIQLNPLIPLDILYAQSHNSGLVGQLWHQHHQALARYIVDSGCKRIFEVGGGHGILCRESSKLFQDLDWTIIEPNPTPVAGTNAKYIRGFFDNNFTCEIQPEAIVHSHVLEHIYFPKPFMANIARILPEEGLHIFSLPNMKEILKRKYLNCLNFEHTAYLDEYFVEYLLAQAGFRILEKSYFKEDHSVFYKTIKDSRLTFSPPEVSKVRYNENKKLFLDYIGFNKMIAHSLNDKISKEQKKSVFIFGAHVFTQYLLAFGLKEQLIQGVLDNDLKKQSRRLGGTHLYVGSPSILKDIEHPLVILRAGVYNQEIKEQILNEINSNTRFIEE